MVWPLRARDVVDVGSQEQNIDDDTHGICIMDPLRPESLIQAAKSRSLTFKKGLSFHESLAGAAFSSVLECVLMMLHAVRVLRGEEKQRKQTNGLTGLYIARQFSAAPD